MKVYEILQCDQYYYFSTEICQGGDLYKFLKEQKTLSEKDVARIMEQILRGINHMHTRDPPIAHRYLKGDNILLESKDLQNLQIKIADFGYASYLNRDKMFQKQVGAPGF